MAKRPDNLKGLVHQLPRRDGGRVEILFYPSSRSGAPILIDVHGGGFISGHHWSDENLCLELNHRLDINVATVEYRYAPEVHYPQATEDAWDALTALLEDTDFDFDRQNVFLIGHSAGGNIVAGMSLLNAGVFPLRGLILDYPYVDCFKKPKDRPKAKYGLPGIVLNHFVKRYFPDKDRLQEPLASPVYAPDEMMAQMPETLIITCELDNLQVDGQVMHRRLQDNGVTSRLIHYQGAMHGFVEIVSSGTIDKALFFRKSDRMRQKEVYQQALDEICAFIEKNAKVV